MRGDDHSLAEIFQQLSRGKQFGWEDSGFDLISIQNDSVCFLLSFQFDILVNKFRSLESLMQPIAISLRPSSFVVRRAFTFLIFIQTTRLIVIIFRVKHIYGKMNLKYEVYGSTTPGLIGGAKYAKLQRRPNIQNSLHWFLQ